jgi:hypothetical protein
MGQNSCGLIGWGGIERQRLQIARLGREFAGWFLLRDKKLTNMTGFLLAMASSG